MAQILILKTLKANSAIFLGGICFLAVQRSTYVQFFDNLWRLRDRIYGRKFRFMERYQYIGHLSNFHHYII